LAPIWVTRALSPRPWVWLRGGILGISVRRVVTGRRMWRRELYPPLVDAAFIIIAWVAVKLLVEFLHVEGYIAFEFPRWLSLGLIVGIFVTAFLYARTQERRVTGTEMAARRLLEEEDAACGHYCVSGSWPSGLPLP